MPFFRVAWERSAGEHDANAFTEHADLVAELLERIRRDGPLSSTDVAPRKAIDWYWRPTNLVRAILEALAEAGRIGITRRDGNRRIYDLIERLFPAELLAATRPHREQRRHKLLSRYRAHGLLGRTGSAELWIGTAPARATETIPFGRGELLADLVDGGVLVPVVVDGVRGERYALADEVPRLHPAAHEVRGESGSGPGAAGRPGGTDPGVAFIAPLDPFAWDRDALRTIYDFDYVWEVYVPQARRRFGYYDLPILFGDRLVGRNEPRIERAADRVVVLDVWWEAGFDPLADPAFVPGFATALDALRAFAGVRTIALPRTARHRAFVRATRPRLGPAASGAARRPTT
jgi:uncharacterized protein YcaQ